MTGKKPRPSTEPIYSGGNFDDFPTNSEFFPVVYTDFISGMIENSERILISQSMHDGYFSGCFATSKLYSPKPALTWWMTANYDSFIDFWKNTQSQNIYSLACDEKFGFGVFLMKGFGTSQSIVTDTANIEKNWDEGLRITACAARGSTFYIVMTKDAKEYQGKAQTWFTRSTWNEVDSKIQKEYKNRKAITGICYSTGLKQYFVVMTKMAAGQCYRWHGNSKEECKARSKWVDDKYQEGFHPTIVFNDPTDDKILIVMTEDKNRLDYYYALKLLMK